MASRQDFLRGSRAATMVEYALLVGLIAIVSIVAVAAVGSNVRCVFEQVATALADVTGSTYTPSGECGPDGVTQMLADLQAQIDALEAENATLESRVTTNETNWASFVELDPRNLAATDGSDDGNICTANVNGEIECELDSASFIGPQGPAGPQGPQGPPGTAPAGQGIIIPPNQSCPAGTSTYLFYQDGNWSPSAGGVNNILSFIVCI